MKNKNFKILYNKDSKVFSIEMKKIKSVDSDISNNVVIDYDKKGNVVRVNFYDFDFGAFKGNIKTLKTITRNFDIPLLVR